MPASRLILAILAGLVLGSATGCDTLFHNLKPHRLWRLNRHSPPMASGSSPYYSVPPPPLSDIIPVRPGSVHEPID
jgi:hypothetical protein